jgi:hypothetical protein
MAAINLKLWRVHNAYDKHVYRAMFGFTPATDSWQHIVGICSCGQLGAVATIGTTTELSGVLSIQQANLRILIGKALGYTIYGGKMVSPLGVEYKIRS